MTAKKIKPGHVARLNPEMWRMVTAERRKGESVSSVLRRLIDGAAKKMRTLYALPSDLVETVEDARGRAVIRAVKGKRKPEKPVAVRVDE